MAHGCPPLSPTECRPTTLEGLAKERVPLEALGAAAETRTGDAGAGARRLNPRLLRSVVAAAGGAKVGPDGAAAAPTKRELLSFTLNFTMDEAEARAQAAALLDRFGSFGALLAAPFRRLQGHLRSQDAAALLKAISLLAAQTAREPVEDRPVIDCYQAVIAYLRTAMRHEPCELVRLLFLDVRNKLVADEIHNRGTIDHCSLYPREVIRRAIEMDAGALIVVHNHPSGDPRPSAEDTKLTNILRETLTQIGVSLHDHIIVGQSDCFSYRENQLLDATP